MVICGGLNLVVALLVNVALIAYLALFPALFAVITRRTVIAFGSRALLAAPFVWVATELGRAHFLGGFPWVLLGYSQAAVLPVAQLASVFGVYGVSALVAMVSAGLAYAAVGRARAAPTYVPFLPVLAAVACVIVVAAWGSRRVGAAEWTHTGAPLRVGLVQGNVDQAQKWDEARAGAIFAEYLRMTRQAIGQGAELVLWPESSTPFYFEEDRPLADRVRTLARQAKVPILIGSDQIEHGVPVKYYNSAFLVQADGSTAGVYRKMHLVPFGEYVPLKRILFFAAPLVEAVSDFSPGESAALLPINGHLISTAICYEIVYPDLVREFVRGGSELLTTITNDAWFGETSAPVSALCAGVDARHRGGTLSGPFGQHRHQRHRRPVRSGARAEPPFRAGNHHGRGPVPAHLHVLQPARRRVRVRVGSAGARGPSAGDATYTIDPIRGESAWRRLTIYDDATKTSASAPAISGVIFEAARPTKS